MLCRLGRKTVNRCRATSRMYLLTIHDHAHILDETVNYVECLTCGSPSLVLRESVQPLQDGLDIILSEGFLHKFDCAALSKVKTSARKDPLDRPCLSSLVARASVESSSTIILRTISSIAGVGGTRIYISRRLSKCSVDSSKSTRASQLDITPLAAWFT